jgi:hypothetical protein
MKTCDAIFANRENKVATVKRNQQEGYFTADGCNCFRPDPEQWQLTDCHLRLEKSIPVLVLADLFELEVASD